MIVQSPYRGFLRRLRPLALAVLLTGGGSAAPAAPAPPPVLTFADCLRRVFANPQYTEPWRLTADKAQKLVGLAQADSLPVFSSVVKYNASSQQNVVTSTGTGGLFTANNRALAGVNATYPLYDAGRARLGVYDALQRAQITSAETDIQKMALLQQTGDSYYTLLYFQQVAASSDLDLQAAQALQTAADEQYRLGLVTKQDVLLAQSAVADAVAVNAANRQALVTAQAGLAFALGEDPRTFRVTATAPDAGPMPTLPLDTLIETARRNSPALRGLQANVDERRIGLDLLRAQRRPDVTLGASVGASERASSGSSHYRWGGYALAEVALTVPLWDSNRLKYAVASQSDDLALARLQLETERLNVRKSVLLQTQNLDALQTTVDSLSQHVALSSEALRLAQGRYRLGLETQSNVLTALSGATTARNRLAQAQKDRNLALQHLRWDLGLDQSSAPPAPATVK